MLNELFALERGLAAAGLSISALHEDLTSLGKGQVLRARLAEGGVLALIDIFEATASDRLWTLRDHNQNGFPGINVPFGLLDINLTERVAHDSTWKEAKTAGFKRAELVRLADRLKGNPEIADWPGEGYFDRLKERLVQLRQLSDNPNTAAVPASFERFLAATTNSTRFLSALTAMLVARVQGGGEEWLDVARSALTGKFSLYIDVELDFTRFSRDTADQRQREQITLALTATEARANSKPNWGHCSLSGKECDLLPGNFPRPDMPGLGQPLLFARNADIPALSRYGRVGSSAMPVEASLARRINGAVEALLDEDRKGKTWRRLPAEIGKNPDLFIASLPANLSFDLADSLAGEDEDDGDRVNRWAPVEEAAAPWVRRFQDVAGTCQPTDEIYFVLLRRVDRGNVRALYNRTSNVGKVWKSAERWARAMNNFPGSIKYTIKTQRHGERLCAPLALAPLSLVEVTRQSFSGDGSRREKAVGLPARKALALFLDETVPRHELEKTLVLLTKRYERLLLGLAQAALRGSKTLKKFDQKFDLGKCALKSVAWTGALLFVLGRPKEKYMSETPYKLGQLLAAVDAVHLGYCADMRAGNAPATLIGNAVFSIAGRNPIRALDILQGRWKPYAAWANSGDRVNKKIAETTSQDKHLAERMERGLSQAQQAGPLCSQIQRDLRSTRLPVDQTFRAELLLGYIAGL